jgi:hypothetical protein
VKNILAAGTAALRVDGDELGLVSPRMVPKDEALQQMAAKTKWPPDLMNVTECLRMDIDR